jgi:hypothetical protein
MEMISKYHFADSLVARTPPHGKSELVQLLFAGMGWVLQGHVLFWASQTTWEFAGFWVEFLRRLRK